MVISEGHRFGARDVYFMKYMINLFFGLWFIKLLIHMFIDNFFFFLQFSSGTSVEK